jgi:hypothetical protein
MALASMNSKKVENTIRLLRLLKLNKKKEVASLIWPWMDFNEQTQRIWDALEKYQFLAIIGHGSASKTFTCAAWYLLDWWQKHNETALVLTSDTIPSMQRRVWSDMKMLHTKVPAVLGGTINESKRMIKYADFDDKNAIHAVAAESDDSATKIQGLHSKYVRVLVDEADNKHSKSIWKAISNLATSGDFKATALANPVDRSSEMGQHVEPMDGWSSINPDVDYEWEGRMGWHVLRLDGLRSPNLTLGYDKYPFMLTNKGVELIRANEGENSLDWWCYVRAWYPPEGAIQRIFSPDVIEKACQPFTFYTHVTPCGACDPAFEGGDDCVVLFGEMGRLHDNKQFGLRVNEYIKIKRKDPSKPVTIDFGDQLIALCKDRNIDPLNFCLDSTGNALGLSDYIRHTWSASVLPVTFGGSPTKMHITGNDSKVAEDRFDRFVSELWYVAREWCKSGLVWLRDAPRDLKGQLEGRIYELISSSQKIKVESKEKMKKRGLDSPDFGDAFCLLVHLVRTRSQGYLPSFNPGKKQDKLKAFRKNASDFEQTYGVKEKD